MTTAKLLLSALAVALLISATTSAQSAQNPPRELVRSREPIVNRIGTGDSSIVIRERGKQDEPNPYPSAAMELLGLTELEELVTIRQVRLEPYLTPNGNWIRTRVTATVAQTFKTGRLALTPGATVSFEVDGGEMIIKGVRVLAGGPPEFNAQRYLIGLQFHPDLKQWQLVKLFELTTKDTIGPVRRRDQSRGPDSKIHGKSLNEISAEVAKRHQG